MTKPFRNDYVEQFDTINEFYSHHYQPKLQRVNKREEGLWGSCCKVVMYGLMALTLYGIPAALMNQPPLTAEQEQCDYMCF